MENSKININHLFKSLNYFLPIILIFSSFKFFGYVLGFLLFIPIAFKNRKKVFDLIPVIDNGEQFVLYYFYYQIIQTIVGAIFLSDFRIFVYWTLFYLVCIYTYFSNIWNFKNCKFYKENITKIFFYSSSIYFLVYFIMNFLSYLKFGNAYEIQNNFWMGSTGAFNLSSILLISTFSLWKKINFKISSIYSYSIILFLLCVVLNDSRLGLLYFVLFLFFISLELIKIKKIFRIVIYIIICSIFFEFGTYVNGQLISYFYHRQNNLEFSIQPYYRHTILDKLNDSSIEYFNKSKELIDDEKNLRPDSTRLLSLLMAKDKFESYSLVRKFIGTGWYTSRVTMSEINNKYVEKYQNRFGRCKYCLTRNEVIQLQGIVAILLDTGLLGMLFTFLLFFLTLRRIIFQNNDLNIKLFYISLLSLHFLSLFIGYPQNNIIYVMLYLPGGLFNYKHERIN